MNKNSDLIKKLRLKKGCKYLLIFPESCGLCQEEIERFPKIPELVNFAIMVKSSKGIKVVEIQKNEQ